MAWAATYMLTEDSLPRWASGRRVVAIGGQTNRPVDDIAIVTDAGGWVTVQAKKGMRVERRPGGALAEALRQLVEIDHVGVPDGTSERLRPLEPERDLVLILSDDTAPRRVNDGLAPAVRALRELAAAVPLSDAASNEDQRETQRLVRDVLGQCWTARWSRDLTDADFRRLTSVLSVRALRIAPDGEDFAEAQTRLRDLVGEASSALDVWKALVIEGQRLAEERGYLDRGRLVEILDAQGIVLRPLARLRPDINRLRALSAANAQSLADAVSITTPDGPVHLTRAIEPALLEVDGNLALTGAPGAGKTVLLHALADAASPERDVVVLRSGELRSTKADTRAEMRLTHDLVEVLAGWTDRRPGLVLIDGLDQARENEAPDWLPALAGALSTSRWRIVASVRSFDLRNSEDWKQTFRGTPILARAVDPELRNVSHLLVGELTEAEIAPLRAASARMATLLDGADSRLRALLSNPFNLDLAGRLLCDGDIDLRHIRSRAELLDLFWRRRIGHGPTALDRTRTLRAILRCILAAGRQSASLMDLPADATQEALIALHHDGVLREAPTPQGASVAQQVLFAHPVLFDYAVAMLALGDPRQPQSLADALDADRNLVVTVRPSLEYRLATVWSGDETRKEYWDLALRLADQTSGHPLAVNETTRVAVSLIENAADVEPVLEAAIAAAQDPAEEHRRTAARYLAFMLAAAAARDPRHQVLSCVDAFALALAQRARAVDDVDLALLAAQLPVRAAPGHSDQPDPPYAWAARTAADCVAVALKQPDDPRRAMLRDPAARLLALVAAVDPLAVSDAITAIIAPAVLRAWGMTALQQLIRFLPKITAKAPDLGVGIAFAPWQHEENRRTRTALLSSAIMGMSSTLSQDLEAERYAVGAEYAKVMGAHPLAGASLLLRIVQLPSMFDLPSTDEWRELPHVRQGTPLAHAGGFGALSEMVNVFCQHVERLADAGFGESATGRTDVVEQIVSQLVSELRHGEVWQRLLSQAARSQSPALARALLPALSSPSLYAHYETWNEAAHAACRAAPLLTTGQLTNVRDAIGAIDNARTNPTRPEHREALASRAAMIAAELEHGTSHNAGNGSADDNPTEVQPPSTLPPIRESLDASFRSLWEAEEPAPGSFDDVAGKVHQQLQEPAHTDEAGDHSSCERLTALWNELAAVTTPNGDQAEASVLTIDIALRLATCPDTAPASALGVKIIALILIATPDETDLAQFDQKPAPNSWTSALTAGWSVTAATRGAEALVDLYRHAKWNNACGPVLRERLDTLLDAGHPIYRFIASHALPAMFPEPDELIKELERRLASETDRHIATHLMRILAWFVHREPGRVDAVLKSLAALPRWAVLTTDPAGEQTVGPADEGGAGVDLIAILAACHGTAHASDALTAWLTAPADHPERATRALHCLSEVLNPADPALEAAQGRTLDLVRAGLVQVRAIVEEVTGTPEPVGEPLQAKALAAVTYAEHLARMLYSASGAFDAKHPTQAPANRGDPRRFAQHALPLLEALSAIHQPRITMNLVQTIDHIAAADPERALRIAVDAVTGDEAYWREPLGVQAALDLVLHFAADHRAIFLGNTAATTAVRRLLESFIRLGWHQAITLAEQLDDLYG